MCTRYILSSLWRHANDPCRALSIHRLTFVNHPNHFLPAAHSLERLHAFDCHLLDQRRPGTDQAFHAAQHPARFCLPAWTPAKKGHVRKGHWLIKHGILMNEKTWYAPPLPFLLLCTTGYRKCYTPHLWDYKGGQVLLLCATINVFHVLKVVSDVRRALAEARPYKLYGLTHD